MTRDLFFIYYTIGEGERLGVPNFEGLKVDTKSRVISFPVKAHTTWESFKDNSFKTDDPQVGFIFKEIQMMNGHKKDFKIWKTEIKTNIPFDEATEYITEKAKSIVDYAAIGIVLLIAVKIFSASGKKK
ncbi:MAG: hypothetical protein L6Q54_15610 [Leptospiraceae bacterium]|nr:hypothetical protein [Leptospiraceae bacterium]MCK6382662.1 hypothetical protein [Leptospiraceae bacterium]NUM42856.1 hypothetical protein [Leptospiraceae bacterium]